MKRTPLKAKTGLKQGSSLKRGTKGFKKRKSWISPEASRKEKENKQCKVLAKQYRIMHPLCECGCGRFSHHVHHTRGRGPFLLDVSTFLAVCFICHNKIHREVAWAREMGYLVYEKPIDLDKQIC